MRCFLYLWFSLGLALYGVDLGVLQLKLNGKTQEIEGVMATIVKQGQDKKLILGATDEAKRTKVNIVIKLPQELNGPTNFSSLNHEVLFTLRSPESNMLIMPRYQPVKTVFREITSNPQDPEGFAQAQMARREKGLYEMNDEERKLYEEKKREVEQKLKPTRHEERLAEYGRMDLSLRVEHGVGIQENPGQKDTAIFVQVEPILENGEIVEIKGHISGYARGKQNSFWQLQPSPFRAIFIQSEGR